MDKKLSIYSLLKDVEGLLLLVATIMLCRLARYESWAVVALLFAYQLAIILLELPRRYLPKRERCAGS